MASSVVVRDPRTWTFTVDDLPDGPNTHQLWRIKHRRYAPIRDSLAWQVRAVRPQEPLQHVHVVVTLVRTSGPPRDPDNAVASVKGLLDGLVIGGLVVDDSAEHMSLGVRQERGTKRASRVHVTEVLG